MCGLILTQDLNQLKTIMTFRFVREIVWRNKKTTEKAIPNVGTEIMQKR